MTEEGAPLLEVREVDRYFGSLAAVHQVSLTIEEGERRALIGPNGAGKTTLFNLIGGVLPVSGGRILLRGEDITRMPEHRRARRGIAKTFQKSNLFDGLTALENVAMAVQFRLRVASRPLRPTWRHREVTQRAESLLEQVGLTERMGQVAGGLSHGERRQLEVAVALAIEPTLLLLDEPVAGMSVAESRAFVEMVGTLPQELTIVVIEHDMDVVFALANRITVLHAGQVLAEGTPQEVRANEEVQEAYLGGAEAEELFRV